MQSQVRFNWFRRRFRRRSRRLWCGARSGSKKVSEKVLGVNPSQVQQVPEKVAEKVPAQGQVRFHQIQQGFQRLASQHPSERFVKSNVAAVGDTTEAYFAANLEAHIIKKAKI